MRFRVCKCPGCTELIDEWSSRRYHSDACRQKAYRLRRAQKFGLTEIERYATCPVCGTVFRKKNPTQKFDRASCRVNYCQKQKRERAKWAK